MAQRQSGGVNCTPVDDAGAGAGAGLVDRIRVESWLECERRMNYCTSSL
jgi:hypothetical protein